MPRGHFCMICGQPYCTVHVLPKLVQTNYVRGCILIPDREKCQSRKVWINALVAILLSFSPNVDDRCNLAELVQTTYIGAVSPNIGGTRYGKLLSPGKIGVWNFFVYSIDAHYTECLLLQELLRTPIFWPSWKPAEISTTTGLFATKRYTRSCPPMGYA
jgi:hypothetical protein